MMLFGMAACFTTVIKAPLTACVIVFETSGMTGLFSGLVLTCLTAYLTASFIGSQAHDEILLTQILESEYEDAHRETRNRRSHPQVYELPVGLQSSVALKKISEIAWPDKSRIVGIIHGEQETIPDGHTLLYPGDKLIVVAEDDESGRTLEKLTALMT